MTVELACRLPPGPDFSDMAVLAESLGYSRIWIFDSAPLTVTIDGQPARMLHADSLTAPRPVDVELWLSVFGPRGLELAARIADGIIGLPTPNALPVATLMAGTVLDAGEDANSPRVREAVGPWQVVGYHEAYAIAGAEAVDAMPGGRKWRASLEALAPADESHLLTHEGHVTHLSERDYPCSTKRTVPW